MTVITVGSVVGAPGATTTALALARRHRHPMVLVEADADGGRLASNLQRSHRPGLVDLLTSARHLEPHELFDGVQQADGASTAQLVVAHPSGDIVDRALRAGVQDLVGALHHASFDVICDVGRYRTDSPAEPLTRVAARRVVVTRAEVTDLAVVAHAVERLQAWGPVLLVVTGRGQYGPGEVREALAVPVVGLPPVGAPLPSRRYLRAIDTLAAHLFAGGAP